MKRKRTQICRGMHARMDNQANTVRGAGVIYVKRLRAQRIIRGFDESGFGPPDFQAAFSYVCQNI
jgi:hypothetical protein